MIEWTDGELGRLAGQNVTKAPDGSLRDGRGEPVSDGLACMLLAHESGTHPVDPADYRRPYLSAGHSADSPMNTRVRAVTIDPATGGRSTTPPDDGGDVGKVVVAEDFARAPLIQGPALPSPGDLADNNSVAPVTGSGTVYEHAAGIYNANAARERAQHVAAPHECVSEPAPARWSPPADLQVNAVPQPVNPGHLTGRAPGER